jgi:hypothetical protein
MSTVEEAVGADTPLGSDLAEGVKTLALNQQITFTKYVRLVLPLDGYVFWVRADMLGPSSLYNKAGFGRAGFNQMPKTVVAAPTCVATGSLHYATDIRQEEPETYAANRMVFTSLQEIENLNFIAPDELYVGCFGDLKFGFSSRSSFYKQANLWHYVGFAVYPDMEPQLIDSLAGFNSTDVIVSNSLPAWLALNGYEPAYGFGNPSLTLFPSFLTPKNEPPPFGAVHVFPETTRGLAMAPHLGPNSSHHQLCAERVRITLWGTRNKQALDFVDCVNQYSLDTGIFGLMNIPVVQDEKRTQAELATIAMKKTIVFEVSYHQSRINDVARQLLLNVIPNFYVDGVAA